MSNNNSTRSKFTEPLTTIQEVQAIACAECSMTDPASVSAQQQKLSRYRSQRKPQQGIDQQHDPLPELQSNNVAQDDGVARSKSRYRRGPDGSRPATAVAHNEPPLPTKQALQTRPQGQRQPGGLKTYHQRTISPQAQPSARDVRKASGASGDREVQDLKAKLENERNATSDVPNDTSRHKPSMPSGELFPPPRPDAVKAPVKPVIVDGPPTSDQIRATKSMSAVPQFHDEDEGAGCFGLFKRKRGEASPQNEKQTISQPLPANEPPTIKPGGRGIVPGTDAPVSAVNAGDRTVIIECGRSTTLFPVTPATTAADLIKSASICMTERINVKSAVLLESFGTVGIQRPLRRYEHVRDVMNSWDSDRQNMLILVEPGTGSSEAALSVAGAPKRKPEDRSWPLWFSQRVGKWDKRFVVLHSEGQVTVQKDPNKPKDATNVCHLSDFDIYTPTQEKMRKKIKPPKKLCFAIKSQQKTSMFESTHDFVHFFCTNDRQIADDFYASIQAWRSWYLVNVLDEGRKPKASETPAAEKEMSAGKTHYYKGSMDSGYQLGSFKPLMEMDNFEKRPSSSRSSDGPAATSAGFTKSSSQFDTTVSPERRTSRARKQHPPVSLNKKTHLAEDEPLANLGRRGSVDKRRKSMEQTKVSPEEFLSSGLLGREYSQRQKEHNERENQKASAFTAGPNLINGGYDSAQDEYTGRRSLDLAPKRTGSIRAQQAQRNVSNGDIHRSNSRAREKPKPLIDLTPQYREPPQHSKKGRGYNADTLTPGNLIEAATSPEDPLGIPPSTDWRGRNNPAGANTSHVRANSLSRNAPMSKSIKRPTTSATAAFTGEGLLAGGQQGWGTGDRGRGVMDGSRARGPMVDLSEPSRFVSGSLLQNMEGDRAVIPAPIIDRSTED